MQYYLSTFDELSNHELYQLLKARVDVFVVEQACPYPELDDNDQAAMHYFIKDGENIVAVVRILPSGTRYDVPSIGRVLVTEGYRGHGYARELLVKSIEFIQNEWKEKRIRLQAQVYLEEFYASLGFERISEEYLDDNIPHVDMIWQQK